MAMQISVPRFAGQMSHLYASKIGNPFRDAALELMEETNVDQEIDLETPPYLQLDAFPIQPQDKDEDAEKPQSPSKPKDHVVDVSESVKFRGRGPVFIPVFTSFVMFIQLSLLIITLTKEGGIAAPIINPMIGPGFNVLRDFAATWSLDIKSGGVHRWLIGIVLPVGVIQFLVLMVLHAAVCMPLERRIGNSAMIFLYTAGGIAGNVASSIFTPAWIQLGSSPSVLAVLATSLLVDVKILQLGSAYFRLFLKGFVVSLILFVLGLFPGSSNWANIAGVFSGLLIGVWLCSRPFFMLPSGSFPTGVLCLIWFFTLLAVGLAVFFILVSPSDPWCVRCMKWTCIDRYDWCSETLRLRE